MSRANMDESRSRAYKRKKIEKNGGIEAMPSSPQSEGAFSYDSNSDDTVDTEEVEKIIKSHHNFIIDVRNCFEVEQDGKLSSAYFANIPITQLQQVFGLTAHEFQVLIAHQSINQSIK